MSKLSLIKIARIELEIILYLKTIKSLAFTKEIADHIGRDDEFVKKLLRKMHGLGIVRPVISYKIKNKTITYSRRKLWELVK